MQIGLSHLEREKLTHVMRWMDYIQVGPILNFFLLFNFLNFFYESDGNFLWKEDFLVTLCYHQTVTCELPTFQCNYQDFGCEADLIMPHLWLLVPFATI